MVDDSQKTKKTRQRSSGYPSYPLEQSIEDTRKLKVNLGDGPYSRDQAAIALGYSGVNGKSASRIASSVHFGLLKRKGSAYAQSDLAKQILNFTSEEEKDVAIIEALKTPDLYLKLILAYDGQALPQMLSNVLVRQHGIADRVAVVASEIFKKSAEFAGVLSNGIIFADGNNKAGDSSTCEVDKDLQDRASKVIGATSKSLAMNIGSVELNIPGTEVTIVFPEKYAFSLSMGDFSNGIKQLKNDLDAINSSLELNDNNKKNNETEGGDM